MKINTKLLKSIITSQVDSTNYSVVPLGLDPYLIDLNPAIIPNKECEVLGRDKEINRIYNQLLRSNKKNAMLIGPHGVGKTALINKLTDNIVNKHCPKEMYTYHVLYFDVKAMIANLRYRSVQRKLQKIIQFISGYNNLVVIIDQIHLMECDFTLSYVLGKLISTPNAKVIGITTADEFYEYFSFDEKTRTHFTVIPVLEPKPKKIYPMIRLKVKTLEKIHGVRISKDIIDYIISVSGAIVSELSNPELTLDLIENSMINAKRKHKKVVDRKSVNSNFNFDYETFRKISPEDKKITAYHEAGHFVTMYKLKEYIKNQRTTAITIVPAEYWLGVTLFEFEYEKQTNLNMDYYVANIAVDLGGRVAEIILSGNEKNYTSGASEDLQNVTRTARSIVMRFGMVEDCSENMAYDDEYDPTNMLLLSDDIRNKIDEATKKLISQAFDMCKKTLEENRDLLDRVANELLTHEIIDEHDLDKICKEVERTENK